MENSDYVFNISQVINTPILPFNKFFNVIFKFSHLLQLSYPQNRPTIPYKQVSQSCSYLRDELLSEGEGPRLISTILSPTGLSPEIIESAVPQILSFAREMETTSFTSGNRRVLTMVLDLSVTTRYTLGDDINIDNAIIQLLAATRDASRISFKPERKDAIEKLEKVRVQDSEQSMECRVCLEEFEVDGEVRRMPCGHLYHGDCIIECLETSSMCPLCRYKMPC